jgi:hypothetical protein
VADGSPGLLRRFAGHGHDLHDLFGGECCGATRTRGIVEQVFDDRQQLGIGEFVLGLLQHRTGVAPTVTPEPDGDAIEAEVLGNGRQARMRGQRQEDEDAAHQALGSGLPLAQLFEAGPLARREFEEGSRITHGRARFVAEKIPTVKVVIEPAAG